MIVKSHLPANIAAQIVALSQSGALFLNDGAGINTFKVSDELFDLADENGRTQTIQLLSVDSFTALQGRQQVVAGGLVVARSGAGAIEQRCICSVKIGSIQGQLKLHLGTAAWLAAQPNNTGQCVLRNGISGSEGASRRTKWVACQQTGTPTAEQISNFVALVTETVAVGTLEPS